MKARHAILMEEALAHLTREYSQERGKRFLARKIRTIIGMVRDWLRIHGFVKLAEMGETDIAILLHRARAYSDE